MKNFLTLLFFILNTFSLICQNNFNNSSLPFEKKQLVAKRIHNKSVITIDGKFDEVEWYDCPIAKDFTMLEPDNGKKLDPSKNTEVKILFDNEGIYIGAILNDDEPKKIMREITARDDSGTSDYFGVAINGYNDGQQEFRFYVTAAGVQLDCNKNSTSNEDYTWNAIWDSQIRITEKGWQIEIKLPYSALRFPKTDTQKWGIQFIRQIRRYRQQYTWNYVNNTKGTQEQQSGELIGLQDIKTPTRLFLFPYTSTYINQYQNETKTEVKGGLDIKYGINDAFTFDAILIPDFGQTIFDDKILNMGPFEQQFNENRPFFTEGTELFNKSNLFYSRRIGGKPSLKESDITLQSEETIINIPSKVNLLNALKLSGRTKRGLGIGIFNAITEKTEAKILNNQTNEIRKIIIEPLANYNITVFDQRFNQNSSISLINTNVTREGIFQDANVTAIACDINNKRNTWNIGGDIRYSIVNTYDNILQKKGTNSSFFIGETAGNIRYYMVANYISKDFDNNDLGINFITNYHSIYSTIGYRTLNPTKKFNSFKLDLDNYQEIHNNSGKLQNGYFSIGGNFTTKKNDSFGGKITGRPYIIYDFYSPRHESKYLIYPENINISSYVSTNYNRKFALDLSPWMAYRNEVGRNSYGVNISPRYRLNNRINLIFIYDYIRENNEPYYFEEINGDVIFAKRNVNTSALSLKGKLAINSTMTINITTRYYWLYYNNTEFLKLEDSGYTTNYTYTNPSNISYSSWNLDFAYSWWIFSGTQLNVLYRNNSTNFQYNLNQVNENLKSNFDTLFGNNLNHTFSVSLRYFLDYNRIKNWF